MAGAYWCMVEDDRQGAPKKVMAEVLGEASRLSAGAGAQTEAVWVTDKATPEGLKQLGEWGAKRIWLLENAAFAPYRAEVWTPAVAELAGQESPQAIFAPVTTRQREFMARLAARLGAGLSADSTGLAAEGGTLVATRPIYAGKLLSKMTWAKTPWMATLRPNVFRPADAQAGASADVQKPSVTMPAETMKLVERRQEASTGLPELTEADLVTLGLPLGPCKPLLKAIAALTAPLAIPIL
jgi:electron transfer flavoprotein alpha subunit